MRHVARRVLDEGCFLSGIVALLNQHIAFATVPAARPVLVGPHQTKRLINVVGKKPVEWSLHQPMSVEPVVIKAECLNTCGPSEGRLCLQGIGIVQICVPEITWNTRLVVPSKPWHCTRDVSPLGKACAPPRIIFRKGMKLRQIKSNGSDARRSSILGTGGTRLESGFKRRTRFTEIADRVMGIIWPSGQTVGCLPSAIKPG